jgi:hypothetical protein
MRNAVMSDEARVPGHRLDEESYQLADVRLLINSPGGSVPGMLAIRDCMRAIPTTSSRSTSEWPTAPGNSCSARGATATG